jgi:hypothetical protein
VAVSTVVFVFVGGASGVTATDSGPPPEHHGPSISSETRVPLPVGTQVVVRLR